MIVCVLICVFATRSCAKNVIDVSPTKCYPKWVGSAKMMNIKLYHLAVIFFKTWLSHNAVLRKSDPLKIPTLWIGGVCNWRRVSSSYLWWKLRTRNTRHIHSNCVILKHLCGNVWRGFVRVFFWRFSQLFRWVLSTFQCGCKEGLMTFSEFNSYRLVFLCVQTTMRIVGNTRQKGVVFIFQIRNASMVFKYNNQRFMYYVFEI